MNPLPLPLSLPNEERESLALVVCVKFSFERSLLLKTVDSLSKAQGTQFVLSQLFMKIKRVFIQGA